MSEQSGEADTDLRRRAAWLLAMLVVVAVLVVVVMTTLLGTDKGSGGDAGPVGPGAITATGPSTPPPSSRPSSTSTSPRSTGSGSSPTSTSTSPSAPATGGPTSCPTTTPCALANDVGNAVADINAIRVQNGLKAVPGSVSSAAQQCALTNGGSCTGGWALTQVSAPLDGMLAVQKISQFAKFTDPTLKAIAVGWAYDPGSKTYYLATIRQD